MLRPKIPEHLKTPFEKLCFCVSSACCAQNIGAILFGRKQLHRVSLQHLEAAIQQTVNLQDEYEYRRLLELLEYLTHPLFSKYVAHGCESHDEEIRETAQEFKS